MVKYIFNDEIQNNLEDKELELELKERSPNSEFVCYEFIRKKNRICGEVDMKTGSQMVYLFSKKLKGIFQKITHVLCFHFAIRTLKKEEIKHIDPNLLKNDSIHVFSTEEWDKKTDMNEIFNAMRSLIKDISEFGENLFKAQKRFERIQGVQSELENMLFKFYMNNDKERINNYIDKVEKICRHEKSKQHSCLIANLEPIIYSTNDFNILDRIFKMGLEIKELKLANQSIQALPESIDNLKQLQVLNLRCNELQTLPESIGNLRELRYLYLENNKLQTLPESIGNLKKLEELFISYNRLQSLPESIGNLRQLQLLNLENNQLQTLPESIGNLRELEEIYLRYNKLQTLPESFGNLKKLKRLFLTENHLQTLPESFGNLRELEDIYLRSNKLQSLPESFGNLEKLEYLNIEDNELRFLPESIGNLKNLTSLNLKNNKLIALPKSIDNLKKLTSVFISNNKFRFELPESIKRLNNL